MTYEGRFDVVIEGVGAERGARVMTAQEGLYVAQHQVPYSTLLGVALRGSILLVVGTQAAIALRGSHEGLATLAAELRNRADLDHLALADRQSLVGERVVFATPVAMSGLMEMERFKGLALAVVTDTAFHVFERGGRHFRTSWDMMTKVDVAKAKFGRLLRIGSGSTQLEVLYLTDAQIQTIRGLASRHSSKVLGVAAPEDTTTPATEGVEAREAPVARQKATRQEAPPAKDLTRRFSIPEFEASLGAIGSGADRPLGAAVERLQMSSLLPVGFMEEHLRELRTIYDGALLRAKREAASAGNLFEAAAALDGQRLWQEVQSSVGVVADATRRAFERQTRRVAANRRIAWRQANRKYMPSAKERDGIAQRFRRGVAELEGTLNKVSASASRLKPAAEKNGAALEKAYEHWHEMLRELDQAYATSWAELSREIVHVWQDGLLPRLARLGGERRRLLPRPIKIGFYFVFFVIVAAVVYLALTGQLGQVIQFE
jgi:hypothetical protein